MDSTDSNTLIIGWLNTGLSPLGKSRTDDATKRIAQLIVKNLIDADQVSLLALGEINSDDLIHFMNCIESKEYDFFNGIKKERKLHFDTGVIYNTKQLELLDSHTITSMHGRRNFKIATWLDFNIAFREGLNEAEKAIKARNEIRKVFEELNRQVKEITDNKVQKEKS